MYRVLDTGTGYWDYPDFDIDFDFDIEVRRLIVKAKERFTKNDARRKTCYPSDR